MMYKDEIISEVWRIRDEYFNRQHHNLREIVADRSPGSDEENPYEAVFTPLTECNVSPSPHPKYLGLLNVIETQRGYIVNDDTPSPVLTLEEFFDGNDDVGSIGSNLVPHPGPRRFFDVLRDIRGRDDVQDVLVEVYEVYPDRKPPLWPVTAERVFVITRESAAEVAVWVAELAPDNATEGYTFGRPQRAPVPAPRMHAVELWWD